MEAIPGVTNATEARPPKLHHSTVDTYTSNSPRHYKIACVMILAGNQRLER